MKWCETQMLFHTILVITFVQLTHFLYSVSYKPKIMLLTSYIKTFTINSTFEILIWHDHEII